MQRVEDILYPIGESGQCLSFSKEALTVFAHYQQLLPGSSEAGGQLFAKLMGSNILVSKASRPKIKDCRTRSSFRPARELEQREIDEVFAKGLHFVGDWHTHPELVPRISELDNLSMAESFRRSTHSLNAFILVVVGTANLPRGLTISLHDGKRSYSLSPNEAI